MKGLSLISNLNPTKQFLAPAVCRPSLPARIKTRINKYASIRYAYLFVTILFIMCASLRLLCSGFGTLFTLFLQEHYENVEGFVYDEKLDWGLGFKA